MRLSTRSIPPTSRPEAFRVMRRCRPEAYRRIRNTYCSWTTIVFDVKKASSGEKRNGKKCRWSSFTSRQIKGNRSHNGSWGKLMGMRVLDRGSVPQCFVSVLLSQKCREKREANRNEEKTPRVVFDRDICSRNEANFEQFLSHLPREFESSFAWLLINVSSRCRVGTR